MKLSQISEHESALEEDCFDEAIKVEEDLADTRRSSKGVLTPVSALRMTFERLTESRPNREVYCSDSGYLDYVGLFLTNKDVELFLTDKEEHHDDWRSKLIQEG
jgi:hypothetical protein